MSRRYLILAGLCLAALLGWAFWLGQPDWPLDDAYIVQHSVAGLKAGFVDPRFPGSTPLQGATSVVHVLIIAALSVLVPIGWAQVLVAALAVFAYLAGIMRLAQDEGLSSPWPGLLAVLGVVSGFNSIHLVNGLETGLAMAAIVWTLVLFRAPWPAHPAAFALLGLLPFIRPELAALSLVAGARAIWSLRRDDNPLPRAVRMAGWGLGGGLLPGLILLVNEGTLLPSTAAAKSMFFISACTPLAARLMTVADNLGWYLGGMSVAGFGLFAVLASRWRWLAAGFTAAFLGAYLMRFPDGLLHNWARYLHILTPFVLAGWIVILKLPYRAFGQPAGRIVFLVALAMAFSQLRHPVSLYGEQIAFARTELASVAEWTARNVPPEARILVHDAGYVSLPGRQALFDLVGLKTPTSIDSHRAYTFGTCSRDPRAIDEIARRNRVTHAVFLEEWDEGFRFSAGLREKGWRVTRIDGERGNAAYRVYGLTPP